jgi:N-methylhydantoinase A
MSVARGRDPRRLAVVGFGGAGPLHACELASAIGCTEVIIPVLPGNTSAIGLALADVRRERSEPLLTPLERVGDEDVKAIVNRLSDEVLGDLAEDGVPSKDVVLHATARVSYEGQRYQLDIPFTTPDGFRPGEAFPGSLSSVARSFRQRHLSIYGYAREEPLALFSVVLVGVGRIGSKRTPTVDSSTWKTGMKTNGNQRRDVWFEDGFYATKVFQRHELSPGDEVDGGAVIDQPDATTLIPPEWTGRVDPHGSLLLRKRT